MQKISLCVPVLLSLLWAAPASGVSSVEMFIGRPALAGEGLAKTKRPAGQSDRSGKFSRLDGNRDGRVSVAELELANKQRMSAFAQADANQDGHLSKDEWQQFKRAQAKADASKPKAKRKKKQR
jgi:EF hand